MSSPFLLLGFYGEKGNHVVGNTIIAIDSSIVLLKFQFMLVAQLLLRVGKSSCLDLILYTPEMKFGGLE